MDGGCGRRHRHTYADYERAGYIQASDRVGPRRSAAAFASKGAGTVACCAVDYVFQYKPKRGGGSGTAPITNLFRSLLPRQTNGQTDGMTDERTMQRCLAATNTRQL